MLPMLPNVKFSCEGFHKSAAEGRTQSI